MSALPIPSMHRRVAFLPGDADARSHDAITKASLAASLARLLDADFAGHVEATPGAVAGAYAVPCETLAFSVARGLGIAGPDDLFGGVVPQPFVATKAITHPLVAADADAPAGWSPVFAERVAAVVLDGRSAFTAHDARRACMALLRDGSVRIKDVNSVGGSGQQVLTDLSQFDALLASQEFGARWPGGLVLERNLNRVQTVSVGQVRVGNWLLSYHGQQRLTRNHRGDEVYGGSSLHLVRGDFDVLLHADLPAALRLAIEQALVYHRSALASFDGMFASRSNYDVVQGVDDAGVWRSGVLEQSWRIGGASGAEVAALHVFRDNPGVRWVDASTHEIHAEHAVVPRGAQLHFEGRDAKLGPLLKYALVDTSGDD